MFCFLRSGRTTACLKESGTEPDERDYDISIINYGMPSLPPGLCFEYLCSVVLETKSKVIF